VNLCVYCASSAQAPPHFGESAFTLGKILAKNRITVVYGGGGKGSMGSLADGVLSEQGEIIGVIPRFMKELEWAHPEVRTIHLTETMSERKTKMVELADAIVALPGGSGTFEELLEVITLKRLGIFLNPVIIVNQEGFYDPLVALFERSVREKFMDERHISMFSVVATVHDVLDAIDKSPGWESGALAFATLR
jgi:uncharacterized protein (TIGR00730 family)